MPPENLLRQQSIDRFNKRFECKFELGQNVSVETAAICLGMSDVLRWIALYLNETGNTIKAIERLEKEHHLLLDRLKAI